MPSIELTYFNGPGRAEPVRMALFIAGLPFTDHRVDFAGFTAARTDGKLPLGQLPVMDVDGVRFTQTGAMLRYVAKAGKTDLYPDDPRQALIVDSAIDTFNDNMSHALVPSMFERDPDKKLEMRKAFVAGPMSQCCSYVEGLVAQSGGPFLTGANLTIADLVLGCQMRQFYSGRLDGITPETLAPYPYLRSLAEAFNAHPQIKAYDAK